MIELHEDVSDSPLYNADLAPTRIAERTWNKWHLASLWVGMSVCIPTYMLGAGLVTQGLTWIEAVGIIFLGNLIVLVPMVLNGHAGTKYGIPLPVFLRASFGTTGAHVPTILRGLVACGWFGIQTWIGGMAIYALVSVLWNDFTTWPALGDFLGINLAQLTCFLFFWLLNVVFIIKGTESIKWLATLSAPILLLIGVALLVWGIRAGGGLGRVLDHSDNFSQHAGSRALRTDTGVDIQLEPIFLDGKPLQIGAFRYATPEVDLSKAPWIIGDKAPHEPIPQEVASLTIETRTLDGKIGPPVKLPITSGAPSEGPGWVGTLALLTAMVGFWATLSLNIPDFTRYARSQKDQMIGQAIGLPTTMMFYSFVGVAVTCAALITFPELLLAQQAPWDPVTLLSRFDNPIVVVTSMFFLAVATLTTNIAANVVAPANGFANLLPKRISFRTGGIITALIGIAIMPWKLLSSPDVYIFEWLIGYSALLGPVAGILIADYYVVRRTRLELAELYKTDGRYAGFNGVTLLILLLAIAPNVPGFLVQGKFIDAAAVPAVFNTVFSFAWFVGFAIAFVLTTIYGRLGWKSTRTT